MYDLSTCYQILIVHFLYNGGLIFQNYTAISERIPNKEGQLAINK